MGWGSVVVSFVGALGRAAWRRRGEEEVGWLLGFSDPFALVVLFFVFLVLLIGFQFSFVALLLVPLGSVTLLRRHAGGAGLKAARGSEGGQQPGRSPTWP